MTVTDRWLFCSTCTAPIIAEDEIMHEEASTLQAAVYMYTLEILDQDVPVYSATNPTSARFDVVRAVLDTDRNPPPSPPIPRSNTRNAELARAILTRLREDPQQTGDHTIQTAEQMLEELDALADDPEYSDSGDGDDRIVIASRILSIGEPDTDYSWFPGYSWTIVHCAKCMSHLGWAFFPSHVSPYTPDEPAFVGIIVTRLRESAIR